MSPPEKQAPKPAEDLTGRDRMVSNVLFSWGAHFVFIIAGFIIPRMIDQRLGRELLGVWDFGWSLVSYFQLVQAGIGSSVSRYVARYRAVGDCDGINRTVSSAWFILALCSLLISGLIAVFWVFLPRMLDERLAHNVDQARWVVLFLGASVASQVFFNAFTGILTGCHRWSLQNGIRSGFHVASVIAMVVVLQRQGGLGNLAAVIFLEQVLADTLRVIIAYRICDGLQISPGMVRRKTIKNLFAFGGKTVVPSLSKVLLSQTTNVLIVAYLGPAALALYARPRSLLQHVHVLVDKMALTLTPTVSSLQGTGGRRDIQNLLIKSVRYALYLAIPMILVVVIFGGPILQFWMGDDYANALLPAIIALGYGARVVNLPIVSTLRGMNAHGRVAVAEFAAALCSVGLTFLTLRYLHGGLPAVAVAATLPLALIHLVYLPLATCRRIGMNPREYFLTAAVRPTLHTLPFAVSLIAVRVAFYERPLVGLIWGCALGGISLAFIYYKYVIPARLKTQLLRLVGVHRVAA